MLEEDNQAATELLKTNEMVLYPDKFTATQRSKKHSQPINIYDPTVNSEDSSSIVN